MARSDSAIARKLREEDQRYVDYVNQRGERTRVRDNGMHMGFDGKLRPGLEPSYEELMEEEQDFLKRKTEDLRGTMPPLKGDGFIVITPSDPRIPNEEHQTIESAQEAAAELAYQRGSAIIYAPVTVVKPRRDVVDSVPSNLLKQLTKIGLPAGAEVPAAPLTDATK